MKNPRRNILLAGAGAAATTLASPLLAQAPVPDRSTGSIQGTEHWTTKRTPEGDVRLFIWRKRAAEAKNGNSNLHGPHQEAHLVTTTGWPRRPRSVRSKASGPPLRSSFDRE